MPSPLFGCVSFPRCIPFHLRGFPCARREGSGEGGLEEEPLLKLSLNHRDRRDLDLNRQGEGAACSAAPCLLSAEPGWPLVLVNPLRHNVKAAI